MRHSPNLRSTLRARPQIRHRRTLRVMNFGFLCALMIIARLAMKILPSYFPNGMPKLFKSDLARSSRPAVVTMVMFSPLDLSVLV
jgi:hypothetical protein